MSKKDEITKTFKQLLVDAFEYGEHKCWCEELPDNSLCSVCEMDKFMEKIEIIGTAYHETFKTLRKNGSWLMLLAWVNGLLIGWATRIWLWG